MNSTTLVLVVNIITVWDFLASVNFPIEAVPEPVVPEPGNRALPLAGLVGMAAMALRRKRCTEQRS
jgi:hypothetical protein